MEWAPTSAATCTSEVCRVVVHDMYRRLGQKCVHPAVNCKVSPPAGSVGFLFPLMYCTNANIIPILTMVPSILPNAPCPPPCGAPGAASTAPSGATAPTMSVIFLCEQPIDGEACVHLPWNSRHTCAGFQRLHFNSSCTTRGHSRELQKRRLIASILVSLAREGHRCVLPECYLGVSAGFFVHPINPEFGKGHDCARVVLQLLAKRACQDLHSK